VILHGGAGSGNPFSWPPLVGRVRNLQEVTTSSDNPVLTRANQPFESVSSACRTGVTTAKSHTPFRR